ncbi:MAG: primosomal protein N' [Candidatus Eisenbacteria sp.]|nr:primosomal protein N' [Candidatus Eisenbacteria bacterium]
MSGNIYAQVSIAARIHRALTYRIPEALMGQVRVGCAVRVPLLSRQVTGFVVSLSSRTEIAEVRDILGLLDGEPVLSAELLELGRWMSAYYMASMGAVLKRALPPGIARSTRWQVRVVKPPSEEQLQQWRKKHPSWAKVLEKIAGKPWTDLRELAREGRNWPQIARRLASKGYLELRQELAGRPVGVRRTRWIHPTLDCDGLREEAERIRRRAPKLARCLEVIADHGSGLPSVDLQRRAGVKSDAVRRLVEKGWVTVTEETAERRARVLWEPEHRPGYELTKAQSEADERIQARLSLGGFHTVLLHGVTGSGKTEVFLRAVEQVLGTGGKALVLVPEISLAGQTVGRAREKFGSCVEVYHSGLSPGERRDSWHRIRRGEASVVVGARSAVFAPLAPLGLIVVDEEQESAYKESEAPRYHARDVALVRARMNGALVILSTATPSFETFHNALSGKYERIALDNRVEGRPLPPVSLVDLRSEPRGQPRVLSIPLRRKIEESLGRKEQIMLFLNRRSFAPHVQCLGCGMVFRCPDCEVALAYHAKEREMKCHLCGLSRPAMERCPQCGERRLRYSGVGTQKVEREIRDSFPGARVERMDLDTTQRKGAHDEIINRFRKQEVDILLGTQMIAKGLDFPQVSLVGVINADTALNLPDFRASERTFDLLTQVAGRAGRGEAGGEVVIQTYMPDHSSLQHARNHDFISFYKEAVEHRRAVRYPPWSRLIRLVCEGPDAESVSKEIQTVGRALRDDLDRRRSGGTDVLGPAPAGFARLKGKHRWHLLVKTTEPTTAREAIRSALEGRKSGPCRIIVDVDPGDMM